MSNHTYITYSEISGYKPSETEVDNLIASLDKKSTFRFLTMLNNFLALFPLDFNEAENVEVQRFLVANLLDKELFEKLRSYVENVSLVDRPIFLRQSILLLMKKVLLCASTTGGLNPDDSREIRNIVGKLCLMISDFTVTFEQEQKTQSSNPHTDEETERVFNELLAQMLPVMELMNPPEISASIVRIQEYIRLSNTHFEGEFEGKTLSSFFDSLTGLTLERFLQMIVGIYATFIVKTLDELIQDPANFNIRKSIHFSNLNYTEKEIDVFYKLTTTKFEELELEIEANLLRSILQLQYDYTVFRKHPLLHLSEDILTPIDFSFLIEKVSFGLYHTILNCFRQNNIDPQNFFQHWGYISRYM